MYEQQTLNIKVKDNPLISSDISNAKAFFACVDAVTVQEMIYGFLNPVESCYKFFRHFIFYEL